ncbi:WD40 repeat-like protein [Mycena rebaudengoi]|nr:WD40 repeat-like protein [Mycena rebaudengoi]
MAASSLRPPHDIPLPQSPAGHAKPQKQAPSRRTKGKAKEHTPAAPEAACSASTWDWTSLTDSFVSSVPPIFTKDGSYFFSLVGCSVRIYAVATGKIVSTLLFHDPLATTPEFWLSGISSEATLLQIIDIAQPIHQICAHENFRDSVFVTASRPGKKVAIDDNAIVLRISLKPADAASQSTIQNGGWLVATAGHKAYVVSSASFQSGFTKYVSPERLTCLAFHPSEEYFATGDEKGTIRLWYCLNNQLPNKAAGIEKKTQTTTLHWHAHSVSSIAFTANGAYLLSGGEEAVLVIWQLHTGKKEFLPRIGSPIKTISVSKVVSGEEEYLLGLADATYSFVGAATLKITRSYSRIKLDPATISTAPSTSKHSAAPLAVHNLTSTLIIPSSHPSSLQIYSPASSTLISELEVSPSNRVSRRDEKPLEPCRVERTTISSSGDWMATIDTREGEEDAHGESYLKIWSWDRKSGLWTLNTRVDRPHGLERVTGVAFSPDSKGHPVYLVTIGADCHVKTWRIRTAKNKTGLSEDFWVARSTLNLVSESPSHVSWSPDASLLAITLPYRVALYNPSTNLLRETLASPECGQINSAYFIGKAGRYLVVVGETDLVLWDLVAQRVRWHHKSSGVVQAVVSHPREDVFAVISHSSAEERTKSKVSLFQVNSPQPSKTIPIPFSFRNVTWYPLVSSVFSLVAITSDWKVVVLGDKILLPKDEGSALKGIAADAAPQRRTLFQDIFGKSAFGEQTASPPQNASPSSSRPWTGREGTVLFGEVAYLMPPLEGLFEPLMNGFLKPRSADITPAPAIVAMDEDVDMDGDELPVVAGRSLKRGVGDEEMAAMVDLFKAHTLKAKAAPAAVGVANRKNRLTNGLTNGGSSRTNLPQNGVGTPFKGSIDPYVSTPSTPPLVVNGKKRKKSMG